MTEQIMAIALIIGAIGSFLLVAVLGIREGR